MVEFLIKSTISLGVLYLFYILVLSGIKTFKFNRYFLLSSLVFSLVIPLISIPVYDIELPLIQSSGNLSVSSAIEYSGEFIATKEVEQNTILSFLPYFYAAISLMLFIRFNVNLFNIIKTIVNNKKIKREGYSIVLLSNQIIPYSFFGYIMVNIDDFNNDRIDKALLQHEVTHCGQWHSIDLVFIEALKVLFWINPFVWLLKKHIQLNHEYLADNSVLKDNSISAYQNILINYVLSNNKGALVSNFNFSLTKQRLKMMTTQFSKKKAISSIFASGLVVVFLGIILAFSQKKDLEYKLSINGIVENYTKNGLKHSEFAMMSITTNKKIKVEEFDITLARGKRAVHYNKQIQGNQFDLKSYSDDARDGDRIVIEILKLSDKNIELTQFNSIITLRIDFDK